MFSLLIPIILNNKKGKYKPIKK